MPNGVTFTTSPKSPAGTASEYDHPYREANDWPVAAFRATTVPVMP